MTERRVSMPAVLGALVLGAIIGGMAVEYWMVKYGSDRPAAAAASAQGPTTGQAADDLAQLKKIVPPQSHTMQDVAHHWTNLWFAVQKGNWPLATYYFAEGRQAMRWTMVIRPVRQMPGGGTIDVQKIFGVLDSTAFAAVQLAVEDNDTAAFEESYKKALTACHSCHSQVGLPQLRPVVPTTPASTILSFEK